MEVILTIKTLTQVYVYSEDTGGVELDEKEVTVARPHDAPCQDDLLRKSSRRSTPAPQRKSRLTKSFSVGDRVGSRPDLPSYLPIVPGSPSKGVRIKDGATDIDDLDLELDSEIEDMKNGN